MNLRPMIWQGFFGGFESIKNFELGRFCLANKFGNSAVIVSLPFATVLFALTIYDDDRLSMRLCES